MTKINDKYSFQNDAINNIVSDFNQDNNSRLLLVIPTGGGKTLTAIRSVDQMIKDGQINESSKCLWVTHRKALKKQTTDVRDSSKWKKKFDFSDKIENFLQIEMVSRGVDLIKNDKENKYKYIIIDECHHSASQSYDILFNKPNLGILGLTATPTRLDRKELVFDKTSYQITFRKLVSLGIIIKPDFKRISTNETIRSSDISVDGKESEKFNTQRRNKKIVESILSQKNDYSKVVIYVNTIKHAMALYDKFQEYTESHKFYDFIGFITASDNHLKTDNNTYLDKFKASKTGIIINTNILTEGYDDPSINTIAMGVPTSSLVRYIQCIGRAIRNPDDLNNQSLQIPSVIEFSDNLPDISYRITSGWLFADISDDLQPAIETVYARNNEDLIYKIKELISDLKLKNIDLDILKPQNITDYEDLNLFVYCAFKELENKYSRWHGFLVNQHTKEDFIFAYNNINNAIFNKVKPTHIFDHMLPQLKKVESLNHSPKQLMNLHDAMQEAYDEIKEKSEVKRLKYYIFEKIPYPEKVEKFLKDCFNKDDILAEYESKIKDNKTAFILKFPSKFINKYEAYYATEKQLIFCQKFIEEIQEKIETEKPYVLNSAIQSILDRYDSFDIPMRFIDGLCLINKEKIKFYINTEGEKL